jgi:REP element-mobilizing transposase RayT
VQLELTSRTWGGTRKGAGRKAKGERAGVSHRRRAGVGGRTAVHVMVKMLPHVWNLRSRRGFGVLERAIFGAAQRYSMRVCELAVMGNHVHLVVETEDREGLGQGMKGFGVRVARGLNRMMGRRGRVLADRYHAHPLRTPTEVRRAVTYVRNNYRNHFASEVPRTFVDPYSSARPELALRLPRARTWPLRDLHPAPERR